MVSTSDGDAARTPDAHRARGLDLHPFRGLRYDPARVSSLGNVTSPPYDVIEPDGVARLETLDPHNVVRLILPHGRKGPTYHHAAETLRAWVADGVLVPDDRPSLYVYEQTDHGHLQRGIVGALTVTPPQAGTVLPHEDVVPAIVEGRTELMRAARANHDPLLLAYQGADEPAADLVERIAKRTPDLETTTPDGVHHRLWAVPDEQEIAVLRTGLSRSRALIADGHHRWATYLRMQRAHREAHGPAPSPWDRGLVLLVDTARHPLRIQAIHRVLPRLPAAEAVTRLGGLVDAAPINGSLDAALAALDAQPADAAAFLLTGGPDGPHHLLTRPSPQLLRRSVRPDRPLAWRRLDATILHRALLAHLWQVPDDPEHIGYAHSAASAARQARESGGSAVLLRPVPEDVVRELAAEGVMMPRKSTSFGPKPATGLVLRDLDLE